MRKHHTYGIHMQIFPRWKRKIKRFSISFSSCFDTIRRRFRECSPMALDSHSTFVFESHPLHMRHCLFKLGCVFGTCVHAYTESELEEKITNLELQFANSQK